MKFHFPTYTLLAPGVIALLLVASGCVNTQATGKAPLTPLSSDAPYKVEVYHFHPTRQYYSCKTLGAYAEKTINESFSAEVMSGRLIFRHVNIYIPEDAELVKRAGDRIIALDRRI